MPCICGKLFLQLADLVSEYELGSLKDFRDFPVNVSFILVILSFKVYEIDFHVKILFPYNKKAIEVLSPMASNIQHTSFLSFCPLKDNLMLNKPDLFYTGS